MNANTKSALIDFITAVETLTASVTIQIGVSNASEIMTACYNLKRALDKDETLAEMT